MKPNLALVRYTSDKVRAVVNVSDITRFNPKSVNDFDPKKTYQVMCPVVRRSVSDLHDEQFDEPYPAKILLLAATDQSMVTQAKNRNEKLPQGYAERVKKELKDKQRCDGRKENLKSSKEEKKALRTADEERYREIIATNVQDSGPQTDTDKASETEKTTRSPVKISADSISEDDDIVINPLALVKAEFHNVDEELGRGHTEAEAPDNEGNGSENSSCVIGSGVKPHTPEFKQPASQRDRAKRELFSHLKSTRGGNETGSDSETSLSSYQSSTSKLKELETKIVSLQLEMQCIKKRNTILSKCLSSHIDHLQGEAERVHNILTQHGDLTVQATDQNNWYVAPSPIKKFSTFLTQSGDNSPSKKIPSPLRLKKTSPLKESGVTGKSTPLKVKTSTTPPSNSVKRASSCSETHTPTKKASTSPSFHTPNSCKSTNPKQASKAVKKTQKKYDSTLKPGELQAEVIADDLLKVLKKEREIQMNENRTKVCIGNNAWVKKGVWKDKFSKNTSNIKKLVQELVDEVWGYPACANMSLTGGKGPKNTDEAVPVKPPAPPGQVEAIYGLCRAQLMWQGMKNPDHLQQSMRQCKEYLRSKLSESARKLKRETKAKEDKEEVKEDV